MAVKVSEVSGNRFNVRAKARDQIKRVEVISKHLGPLGDLLVTTWGGIFAGIAAMGIGIFVVGNMFSANGGATIVANIVPILLEIIGFVVIALNLVLTNPSRGSQLIISYKYLITKIKNYSNEKVFEFKPFRFDPESINRDVLIQSVGKKEIYMAVYSLRGAVSPVSFSDELEFLGELDRQRLDNLENSHNIHVTINMIQKAKVTPIKLPTNATPAMRKKRDYLYDVINNLHNNQQLKTDMIIVGLSRHDLKVQTERLESIFDRGLVIGYMRLADKDLKREFRKIYG